MAGAIAPTTSVVLPCYGSADLARHSVDELREVLEAAAPGAWEILVVDDGGGDFGPGEWQGDTAVRLIVLPENRGKGAAVKAGMLAARGRARVFTDVDLPYGPSPIPVIAERLAGGPFHLVIGDRSLPDSRYWQEIGPLRRGLSKAAALFAGVVLTGGFFDTQCGLKGVRGDVTDILLPLLTIDRFAFDAELVYLALRHGCHIERISVRLRGDPGPSTVRPFRDMLEAGLDVLRVKLRALGARYDSPALDELIRTEAGSRSAREGR